jgi:hypothetical protein
VRESGEVIYSEGGGEEEIIQQWLLENSMCFCRICGCLMKL